MKLKNADKYMWPQMKVKNVTSRNTMLMVCKFFLRYIWHSWRLYLNKMTINRELPNFRPPSSGDGICNTLSARQPPAIWKHAITLPIPKPRKPKDQKSFFRPISFICPASKALEKLISQLVAPHLPLADTQHGFRSARSTTFALLPLTQQVVSCFKQQCSPTEQWQWR